MKKIVSLKWKIIAPIVSAVTIGNIIIIGIFLSMSSGKTVELSGQYISEVTHDYATQVSQKMELALNTAETLSSTIEQMSFEAEPSRADVTTLVGKILSEHSELVGIGVGFEPNAFDGKDALNIGQKHSDATGRFVPYTFREGGVIDYTILSGYDDPGPDGSWYSVPKATGKTYVTSPYWYEVGNEKFLIVTCVAPLHDKNEKFVGMVGFDIRMESLNAIFEGLQLFDTGYLTLVSSDGTIAYNPNQSILGKTAVEVFDENVLSAINMVVNEGKVTTVDSVSRVNGQEVLNTMVPIKVGESGGRWVVSTSVPRAEFNKEVYTSGFFGMMSAILVTIIIWIMVNVVLRKRILNPVFALEKAAAAMAGGDLSAKVSYHSEDELGNLAKSMTSMMTTLSAYITNISETLQSMSQGNMQIVVNMDYVGDFAPIKSAINEIVDSLNDTISQINEASDQVFGGSDQVSMGAQALSQGATEQASATEQLAATVGEISFKVAQSAKNALQVTEKAELAGVQVENSHQQMQSMIGAMTEIKEKSNEISKIIKTIEDIAFQTNILALNAAVEAARAGVAGKGFAVVADEVRNLAGKSAIAAQSTTELIEQSILAVQNGVKIADMTADGLDVMMAVSGDMMGLIEQMAQSSGEQATAIGQVSVGIDQISAVVQTNSATAEESAAASAELSSQASRLKNLVQKFRLKE